MQESLKGQSRFTKMVCIERIVLDKVISSQTVNEGTIDAGIVDVQRDLPSEGCDSSRALDRDRTPE